MIVGCLTLGTVVLGTAKLAGILQKLGVTVSRFFWEDRGEWVLLRGHAAQFLSPCPVRAPPWGKGASGKGVWAEQHALRMQWWQTTSSHCICDGDCYSVVAGEDYSPPI